MLSKDQIENLKPGDFISIHTRFDHVDESDGIWFNAPTHNCDISLGVIRSEYVTRPSEQEVPTPKHDPTRLFKKGDIVNVTSRDGRYPMVLPMNHPWVGENVTVVEDEDGSGSVQVRSEAGVNMDVAFFFLKLVSTVEERMPYSIDPANTDILLKYGKKFATFEDDDAAQELCDRLNAEYRKEHGID